VFSKDLVLNEFNVSLGRDSVGKLGSKEQRQFAELSFKDSNNANQQIVIVNISSGDFHVLALDYDRNLWAWGNNQLKQINPYNEQKEFMYPTKIEHKV
jgi:alpha-tubulin suppressor-like RCC1 family protein